MKKKYDSEELKDIINKKFNNGVAITPVIERKKENNNVYNFNEFSGKKIPIIFDVMYQNIINNEKYKKYAAYIISKLLGLDKEYVLEKIKIEKSKLSKDKIKDKGYTVDFICDLDGVKIEIEMNNCPNSEIAERNIAYGMRIFSGKKVKDKYNMVIVININNFVYEKAKDVIDYYQINNKKMEVLTDKFKIVNIYLPKIREKYYNKDKLSDLERMLLVMVEENEKILNELIKGEDKNIMEEFISDAKDMSEDTEILGLYNKELEELELQKLLQEQEYEKGIEKGVEKGILETAKRFLANGASIEMVVASTGLTEEQVKKL